MGAPGRRGGCVVRIVSGTVRAAQQSEHSHSFRIRRCHYRSCFRPSGTSGRAGRTVLFRKIVAPPIASTIRVPRRPSLPAMRCCRGGAWRSPRSRRETPTRPRRGAVMKAACGPDALGSVIGRAPRSRTASTPRAPPASPAAPRRAPPPSSSTAGGRGETSLRRTSCGPSRTRPRRTRARPPRTRCGAKRPKPGPSRGVEAVGRRPGALALAEAPAEVAQPRP
jgi:hypothetical protein